MHHQCNKDSIIVRYGNLILILKLIFGVYALINGRAQLLNACFPSKAFVKLHHPQYENTQ